jgi:hypothetical protein
LFTKTKDGPVSVIGSEQTKPTTPSFPTSNHPF